MKEKGYFQKGRCKICGKHGPLDFGYYCKLCRKKTIERMALIFEEIKEANFKEGFK